MIIDAFTFFNELDILNARLNELFEVVDLFVIVESTKTFSNQRKSLFFAENKVLYDQFSTKIRHVIVDDMPDTGNAWHNETHQRNCITRGLEGVPADALIMIGDVDEIPDKNMIPFMHYGNAFRQQFFYYNELNELDYYWHGTQCVGRWQLAIESPQEIRERRYNYPAINIDGWHGWHLSYWGGVDRIQSKIESMSDTHLNVPEFTDNKHLQAAIDNGVDLFKRNINIVKHKVSPIPERILRHL